MDAITLLFWRFSWALIVVHGHLFSEMLIDTTWDSRASFEFHLQRFTGTIAKKLNEVYKSQFKIKNPKNNSYPSYILKCVWCPIWWKSLPKKRKQYYHVNSTLYVGKYFKPYIFQKRQSFWFYISKCRFITFFEKEKVLHYTHFIFFNKNQGYTVNFYLQFSNIVLFY